MLSLQLPPNVMSGRQLLMVSGCRLITTLWSRPITLKPGQKKCTIMCPPVVCVDFDLLQPSNTTSSHSCILSPYGGFATYLLARRRTWAGTSKTMTCGANRDARWGNYSSITNRRVVEKYLSLLVLLFRCMERYPPQLAAKPSGFRQNLSLRVPSDSRSDRRSTPSTLPVCDVSISFTVALQQKWEGKIKRSKQTFVLRNLTGVVILGRHDANQGHHRPHQKCSQVT